MTISDACVDCQSAAPDRNTNHTLISQFGWRAARKTLADGTVAIVWRCPACWGRFKEMQGIGPAAREGAPRALTTPPARTAAKK